MPPFTELAAAAALLAFAKMALDFYSRERDKDRIERTGERAIWENHLSGTVEALTRIHDEQKRQGEDSREHYRIWTK